MNVLVRTIWLAFGASLIASGVAKVLAPWVAIAGLHWTGLDLGSRNVLVSAASVLETVLGALVVSSASRRVAQLGFVASVALALLHAASLAVGDGGDCGCFGDWRLGDELVFGVAGAGCATGWALMRRGASRPVGRVPVTIAAAAGLACIALVVFGRPRLSRDSLRQFLMASHRPTAGLGVIGGLECDRCHRLLRQLRERRQRDDFPYEAVSLIVPVSQMQASPSEAGRDHLDEFAPWLTVLEVPDEAWWAWIESTPPVQVAWDVDFELTEIAASAR